MPHRQNRLTDLFIGDRFQLRKSSTASTAEARASCWLSIFCDAVARLHLARGYPVTSTDRETLQPRQMDKLHFNHGNMLNAA